MAFKVKKPPAIRKPAPPKPAAPPQAPHSPQETPAKGTFWDPINKGPEVPPPTFEQQDDDPLTSAINGELGRLNQQDVAANRQQYGTQLGRLQEDAASKLANIQTQRQRLNEDVRRQQDELRRRAPIEQRNIAARQAGRGGYFSSAREEEQADASRQTEQAIQSGERELSRGEQDFQSAADEAKKDAERARQDLEANKADFERRVKEGEFKTAAAAAKAQTDSQRSEAGSWTNARYNELVASGASPEQARSRAISDARGAYPKVGDTWIAGSLAPSKGVAKPNVKHPTQKVIGVEVSAARAKTIKPNWQTKLRKRPTYAANEANLAEYKKVSGNRNLSAAGFLQWTLDNMVAAGMKPKVAKSALQKDAGVLSMLMLDAGLD